MATRALPTVAASLLLTTTVSAAGLEGRVTLDGSSTVYPISEAVGEEFQKANPAVKVTVGISGTGGGFKKFCAGETDISDASRPIKPTEVEQCTQKGIEYIELPIAYDGLAVLVNPKNNWATCMTVSELKSLWQPEAQGTIKKWNQVRPTWPDKDIHLFGAGVDSGTYDYFTDAIVGKEHSSRGDYQSSEDDNVLVQGIGSDELALGFFGVAYYQENKDKLKLVGIDDGNDQNGKGCMLPTPENVEKGLYQPLARPIFIYVAKTAAERPEIQAFVKFYMQHGAVLVNSGPLSTTIRRGSGRLRAKWSRTRITRRPESPWSTSIARHSRLASSTMFSVRKVRPLAKVSPMKSIDQRSLGCVVGGHDRVRPRARPPEHRALRVRPRSEITAMSPASRPETRSRSISHATRSVTAPADGEVSIRIVSSAIA